MRDPRLPCALALVAVLIGATGCGDDDETAASGSSATTPASAPGVPAGVAAQYRQIEEEVAAEGGETRAGPWRIAYIVEPAEGWFERRGGALGWRAPARAETHHIKPPSTFVFTPMRRKSRVRVAHRSVDPRRKNARALG
ncbi:MAG: hypothetical protein ACRDN8_11295 [Thermoleophilaceae bacterium]